MRKVKSINQKQDLIDDCVTNAALDRNGGGGGNGTILKRCIWDQRNVKYKYMASCLKVHDQKL